jgi:hypothetical protein
MGNMKICPEHARCPYSRCEHHDIHRHIADECTKVCVMSKGKCMKFSGDIIEAMNEVDNWKDKVFSCKS